MTTYSYWAERRIRGYAARFQDLVRTYLDIRLSELQKDEPDQQDIQESALKASASFLAPHDIPFPDANEKILQKADADVGDATNWVDLAESVNANSADLDCKTS